MIDLSEFFDDPNFSQEVVLFEGYGEFISGEWYQLFTEKTATMIVQPTTPDDLQMLQEGERYLPSKMIHSEEPIKVGDEILYQGDRWRIKNLNNWGEYGYYHGIAIRRGGTETSYSAGFTIP